VALNLHAAVRGAITSVNPDILASWLESLASTVAADYRPSPTYTRHDGVRIQVQALSGKELQHPAMLSVQGVTRGVYMFGTVQGVSKPQAKGGDLLQFPMVTGGPVLRWLVTAELEQWDPAGAWTKVAVVLQDDAATTPVPDVVGMTQSEATEALAAALLSVGTVTSAYSETIAAGDIISQLPGASSYGAPYGSAVAFVLSLGPEPPP
jgi:PASTA domain